LKLVDLDPVKIKIILAVRRSLNVGYVELLLNDCLTRSSYSKPEIDLFIRQVEGNMDRGKTAARKKIVKMLRTYRAKNRKGFFHCMR
jgi:hypothetical protein